MLARRAPSLLLPSFLAAFTWLIGACAQSENVVLLEARTQGDIESIQVTVIDRSGARTARPSSPRPVRRSAREINSGDPIRLAIPLPGPMDVIVHVMGTGVDPDDRFVATRCYGVSGVVRDTVLLVGPIGTDIDGDSDGFPADPGGACRDPGEGSATLPCRFACPRSAAGDCDDADDTIHPGAYDYCRDEIDQDCDGSDAECVDRDGDGYNNCSATDVPGTCDCDDSIAGVNPGAEEECRDGVDQDCDGRDGLCDQDGDGYVADRDTGGSPDCDDTDPAVHPGAPEICTPDDDPEAVAQDEDCNGFIDDAEECTGDDLDRDGSDACTDLTTTPCPRTDCDCNDCDSAVHPRAQEICGNGIDEDQEDGDAPCPSTDGDGDGYAPTSAGGQDCNDADPGSYPNAPERCGDGASQSCDVVEEAMCSEDADGDGFVPPADCAPDDPQRTPGATEQCNQVDDDCDGVNNEVLSAATPGFANGVIGCVLGDGRLGETCGGSAACQIDFTTSIFHCGGCRVACNAPGGLIVANECANGVCDCTAESSTIGPCASGTSCCVGRGCVDLQTDEQNCGYCGQICGANADTCDAGTCTCAAAGGACNAASAASTCCGTGCVDLDSDEMNCGACGNQCGQHSTCSPEGCLCDAGWGDCNGIRADGCETNLLTTDAHCGVCNNVCSLPGATAVCMGGTCQIGACGSLRDDCDMLDSNGCETSLQTLGSCGACGVGCSRANATPTCEGGTCATAACLIGFGSCDGNEANGCENTLDSLSHCGTCGTACARANASATCTGDTCRIQTCTAGFGNCDTIDSNGCENTLDSVTHCGACGTPCARANGITSCAGDVCALVGCMPGFADCDGNPLNGCENTLDTLTSCGACGTGCSTPNATPSCSGDVCHVGICVGGFGDCDGVASNGCENTLDSLANCGACGSGCSLANATPTCATDACRIASCNPGYGDCNGLPGDGCERSLDTRMHCGACGVPCNRANATSTCAGGTCAIGTCDPGYDDCDGIDTNGCETPTSDDTDACGACGVSCGVNETCMGGQCYCGLSSNGIVGGGPACTGGQTCRMSGMCM